MDRRKISKEIYYNVIKTIPTKIIEMLPETPDKLLEYADRMVEIKFSNGISNNVKELMKEYLLDDAEYLRTFYYVMAITFYNKKTVDSPKIAIVAAQTGSGKSNLTAKLLREDSNFIFIDSDKYKHFRFDAQDIANKYQVLYPHLTGPDGYDHAANIYKYALDKKYNIIKESAPSTGKSLVDLNMNELNKNNYQVSVHVLAVGELNSTLSVHERYELQIIHGLKTAKLTGLPRHDESYCALIENIKELQKDSNINVNIYMRGSMKNNFEPIKIYPSDAYSNSIIAIEDARTIDNNKTVCEFNERYRLIQSQMMNRTTPKEQLQQLESLKERYNKLGGTINGK